MSGLMKLVGGLLGLLVIVIALGFVLPSQRHVERAILIDAPPETVFAWVGDFNQWDAWSPWAQKDPPATMAIAGLGLGQTMTWQSDHPEVGSGSQEIVEIKPPSRLKTHLDFGDRGYGDAVLQLAPEAGKTRVTWSLDTDMRNGVSLRQQPLSTYMGFLMDAMVGNEYEVGLQNLKAIAEHANKA